MSGYPTHEVWGGYVHNGECDEPRHLEDCFGALAAETAATEWAMGQGQYAFVRAKDADASAHPPAERQDAAR